MKRALTFLQGARRNPKLTIGVVILTLVLLAAILNGPLLALDAGHLGRDPLGFGPDHWALPDSRNLLGTDGVGRDVLALIIVGLVTSVKIGLIAGVCSTVIAVVIAFIAAYKGGIFDIALAGFTDVFLVIPTLPLLIVLSAFDKNVNLVQIGLVLAIFSWPGAARHIRSQVLSLRSRPYVDLAKVSKLNDLEIIFKELLPNMAPFVALGMAYAVVASMTALIGLEVIGLGPSGVIDLGLVLNYALGGALTIGAWGIVVAPILLLALIFFALTLVNIGLEATYNPRLRKVAGA